MAVNKVEVNGETKLDLTQDTVTPENLLSGATAHNAAGERISGAVAPVRYDVAQDLTSNQKTRARGNIDAASIDEVNAIPKPNLFINPLFQIWQQYPSGWSGVPVNHYVCDGWRVLSSDGSKQNNLRPASPYGMANAAGGPNCTISQFLENAAQYNGLKMTCSVLKKVVDGTQSFITATKTASGWTDSTDILAFFGTSSLWRWINSGETLIGAKLEVGTQQTFVHKQANGIYVLNSVPTVAEQLAICNKYDPETGKLLGGWEHPPMELGIEYRTMERYLGKPVYVKALNVSSLPNNGNISVNIATNSDGSADETIRAITAYGVTSNGSSIPAWACERDTSKKIYLQLYLWIVFLDTTFDASGVSATIVVKYTKTTD